MRRLYFDIQHLATAIHAVGRIDAMRAEASTILWIFRELRKFETNGTAALAAALLGLFAFWLCHKMSLVE